MTKSIHVVIVGNEYVKLGVKYTKYFNILRLWYEYELGKQGNDKCDKTEFPSPRTLLSGVPNNVLCMHVIEGWEWFNLLSCLIISVIDLEYSSGGIRESIDLRKIGSVTTLIVLTCLDYCLILYTYKK